MDGFWCLDIISPQTGEPGPLTGKEMLRMVKRALASRSCGLFCAQYLILLVTALVAKGDWPTLGHSATRNAVIPDGHGPTGMGRRKRPEHQVEG